MRSLGDSSGVLGHNVIGIGIVGLSFATFALDPFEMCQNFVCSEQPSDLRDKSRQFPGECGMLRRR
ncbi:MAG: hypothetical protein BGO51_00360 [Rhodospirillales bacterium 69-11]|nr:MAG: hypothetical protein BGO51_00360 [Rhodospirillales bacterium 69-11]